MTAVISEKPHLSSNLLALDVKEPSSALSLGEPTGEFAGKLDSAVATTGQSRLLPPSNAQKLAEILNLQMLHSTLTLAGGDQPAGSPLPPVFERQSATIRSLLRTYGANQAENETAIHLPDNTEKAAEPVESAPSPDVGRQSTPAGLQWLEPIISKASRRYGVDASLIKAVIKAESNFNTHAVSPAGARGLMQLMPGTARSLGVSDSFNPEQNVMAGTRFLRDLLNRYNGDLDSTLAAYNWGPGNVDKRPDRLPRETRDYLSRVKQLYSSFSA